MLIQDEDVEDWVDLQNRVKNLFREMDYHAESPKTIPLAGRGNKEVDVYVEDKAASVTTTILVECKWWETNVPQDTVHAFHTIMHGSGANTGFIVSKVGFQAGAKEAAQHTNINLVTFEELQHAYGDEWFRRQMAHVRRLENEMGQHAHLHFDQWNNLPIHNNMIFHTPRLQERLMIAAKHCTDLTLQCRSRFPGSYLGPEPVQMASDPSDPFKEPPDGKLWHEAATVREYFALIRGAAEKWVNDFEQLHNDARHSFDALDEEKQDEFFGRAMLQQLEETPVRVLKRHVEAAEYQRLIQLLGNAIADAASGGNRDGKEESQEG